MSATEEDETEAAAARHRGVVRDKDTGEYRYLSMEEAPSAMARLGAAYDARDTFDPAVFTSGAQADAEAAVAKRAGVIYDKDANEYRYLSGPRAVWLGDRGWLTSFDLRGVIGRRTRLDALLALPMAPEPCCTRAAPCPWRLSADKRMMVAVEHTARGTYCPGCGRPFGQGATEAAPDAPEVVSVRLISTGTYTPEARAHIEACRAVEADAARARAAAGMTGAPEPAEPGPLGIRGRVVEAEWWPRGQGRVILECGAEEARRVAETMRECPDSDCASFDLHEAHVTFGAGHGRVTRG